MSDCGGQAPDCQVNADGSCPCQIWTDQQIDNIALAGGEAFLAARQMQVMKRRIERLERERDEAQADLETAMWRHPDGELTLIPPSAWEANKDE